MTDNKKDFLPISKEDMQKRGWDYVDFAYVIGDAYVDHSSFGPAIISRVLESQGYRVGIISQPDWKKKDSIDIFGKPRLGFLVSAGNMDSMVNHYSVAKKRRNEDAYTPGGVIGKRPDYATIVYSNLIRQTYKNIPIIIGGVEASLRRMAHYDYWSDSFKRSVLLDSQADILLYGMGERSIVEIADALSGGLDAKDITYIKGSVYKTKGLENIHEEYIELPSYEEMLEKKVLYAKSFGIQSENTDPFTAKILIEKYDSNTYIVQNPPQPPLTTEEFDEVCELPYMRAAHPSYDALGGVAAVPEVKFGLTANRGCFGSCSFCSIAFHQGRILQTRSHESLIREANLFASEPDFKGYIHDVGGPTANFSQPSCKKQLTHGVCKNRQCLFPTPCKNMTVDHSDYMKLLRKLRALPHVKKVFIRSGIRFDYLMADPKRDSILKELAEHHISGQMRVAPEHISDVVLDYMGKPKSKVYKDFVKQFEKVNDELGQNQFVVPYLMSSHPGCTLTEAVKLAEYLHSTGHMPERVQDFYPTPSTASTCMYYTGYDPRTMKKVYTAKNPHVKAMQRALMQYKLPQNYELVKEALTATGREDLIGYDKKCLIRPLTTKVSKPKTSLSKNPSRPNSRDNELKEKTKQKRTAPPKKYAASKQKRNQKKR